jgi:hypothetical protein
MCLPDVENRDAARNEVIVCCPKRNFNDKSGFDVRLHVYTTAFPGDRANVV